MEEIVYKIDNWSLIKLIGGIGIIISGIFTFFSKFILNKIQYNYEQKIETLKAEISKSNNLLNSSIQHYLYSSQKIVDKKIIAYETLWKIINETRDSIPASISMIHFLFPSHKFEESNIFETINNNPKIGPVLRNLDLSKEMEKMGKNGKNTKTN